MNYYPGKEELYIQAMLEECQCDNLWVEEGILYNNVIGFDLDLVEKMEIDIIACKIAFLLSTDEIYVVDFKNETIIRA
ncbi:hypothetical protein [Clostridium pasteurianum]|uniref:Uncharacterized protein n=1 Tax=Clostridium pasteurianum BC1 TaxID=86416 RepID=R4KAV3_CLOPA|nr:hypothetical protein [Clostridium pasteurianum]AGK97644.1 hypothetical protein Clopa_2806 [Clostridium pasteurianum BC1]